MNELGQTSEQGGKQDGQPGCQRLLAQLDDWIDGSLEPAAETFTQAHLGHCLGCRREAEQLSALVQRARGLPAERELSRDLWPEVAARIGRRRQWRAPAAVAAFLAAAAFVLMAGAAARGPGGRAGTAAVEPEPHRLAQVSSGGMGGGGVGGSGGATAGSGGGVRQRALAGNGPPDLSLPSWR